MIRIPDAVRDGNPDGCLMNVSTDYSSPGSRRRVIAIIRHSSEVSPLTQCTTLTVAAVGQFAPPIREGSVSNCGQTVEWVGTII
jgi:hypothetical protein